MRLNRFDPVTGCYRGFVITDDAALYDGQPGYSATPLPVIPAGMTAVMTAEGAWSLAVDMRGKMFHNPQTGEQRVITVAGETPPAGWIEGPAPAATAAPPSLNELRKACERRIDAAAGRARLRYLTDAPGQDATYTAKYSEALAYIAAGYPTNLSAYPYVAAEAAPSGALTPTQAATRIASIGGYWRDVKGPQIEGARITGKDALLTFTNADDMEAHTHSVVSALEAL